MEVNESKIGRNHFCPCGSQKKYKKCCLLIEKTNGGKSAAHFGHRIQNRLGNNVILLQGDHAIKISEIILHLAENLLDVAKTKAQHQFAINITCTAWNMAVTKKYNFKFLRSTRCRTYTLCADGCSNWLMMMFPLEK